MIKNEEYDEERVINHLKNNMSILEMKNVYYKVPVNIEQVEMWIKMTLMLTNVSLAKEMLSRINEVTIDVNICVCRKEC